MNGFLAQVPFTMDPLDPQTHIAVALISESTAKIAKLCDLAESHIDLQSKSYGSKKGPCGSP